MRALLAAALVFACTGAAAQQWASELKGSPAEVFTEEDNRLFFDTIRLALEREDDQALVWENPKTGHRGDAQALKRFESHGRPCKEIEFHAEAQGRKGHGRFNYCRIEGEWKLLGASQL